MSSSQVAWLSPTDPVEAFPAVNRALREPDGLLAAGGDLSRDRLLAAYRAGIFPWYEEGQPILWWSPDPRCVLNPENLYLSRRLRQYARRSACTLSFNQDFAAVITACAGERRSQQGTWITRDIQRAFLDLHADGWAHSVEVWDSSELVGGIYGLSIGRVFFGESMFSHRDNTSKFAMLGLCSVLARNNFELLDCQVLSQHLLSLGARLVERPDFVDILDQYCANNEQFANWPTNVASIGDFLPK
ncbi:MAG: leucyl/phenylalanyl-tRNA--protein transferase [Woeseiaceae bacterium]